jgi:hypothetical protein
MDGKGEIMEFESLKLGYSGVDHRYLTCTSSISVSVSPDSSSRSEFPTHQSLEELMIVRQLDLVFLTKAASGIMRYLGISTFKYPTNDPRSGISSSSYLAVGEY